MATTKKTASTQSSTSGTSSAGTRSTNPNADSTTGEETEPEPFVNQEDDYFEGIPGQIQYPDRRVDAERAAAFAAGKADSLYPDDEDGSESGWQNPADRPTEEQTDENDSSTSSTSSRGTKDDE